MKLCKKGLHDLDETGTYSDGRCKRCCIERSMERQKRLRKGNWQRTRRGPRNHPMTDLGPPTWAVNRILDLGSELDTAPEPEAQKIRAEIHRLRDIRE